MTHTDLLSYVAENAPVKITTHDGQEITIAGRDYDLVQSDDGLPVYGSLAGTIAAELAVPPSWADG